MEVLAIIGGFILGIGIVFGWTCLEAWLGTLALNWLCMTLGIAFSITFWQTFIVLFLLSLIGKRFRTRIRNQK